MVILSAIREHMFFSFGKVVYISLNTLSCPFSVDRSRMGYKIPSASWMRFAKMSLC